MPPPSAMLSEAVRNVLADLSERERKVVRLRFGLDDGQARTLEEVGKEFGVTRERVRQIESKSLAKLRQPLRSGRLQGLPGQLARPAANGYRLALETVLSARRFGRRAEELWSMRSSRSGAFRGEAGPPSCLFRNVDLRFLNGGQAPFVVSWPLFGADRRPPCVPAALEAFRGAGRHALRTVSRWWRVSGVGLRAFDVPSTPLRRPSEVQLPLSGARLLLRCAPARRKRCSGTENTLMHLERGPGVPFGPCGRTVAAFRPSMPAKDALPPALPCTPRLRLTPPSHPCRRCRRHGRLTVSSRRARAASGSAGPVCGWPRPIQVLAWPEFPG